VEAASVAAGVGLVRWFFAEARRVYRMLAEDETEWHTRRLIEFIQSQGGAVTARRLQRSNAYRYRTTEAAEQALTALVEKGMGAWEPVPTTAKGGTPTRTFRLNISPTADTTDTTSAADEGDDTNDPAPPPDTTPKAPGFSQESEGSVSCVSRRADVETAVNAPDAGDAAAGGAQASRRADPC